jgi:AcrR family transcriptional regulator
MQKTRANRIQQASRKRRAQQKQATRRAILDAAAELFADQGYENFSLRQVAEAIGYTPTTIYLYFQNKDDLLFQTAAEGFATFGEMLQAAYDSAATPQERLNAIGQAYVSFGLSHPVHYRLMFMQRGEFLLAKPAGCDEAIIDSFGILRQTLTECMAAGLIPTSDSAALANTIWSGVHGIVALAISIPSIGKEAAYDMLKQYQQIVKQGLFR